MKRNLLVASAALVIWASANAAPPSLPTDVKLTAERLVQSAQKADTGYRLIEGLTTEVGPRLAGSSQEARARDWAVREFKALGFKNVRIETFDMPYWGRETEQAEIVSPFPQALTITAIGGTVGTGEGGLTAEVVRFPTLTALADSPMDSSLQGKIVFVDEPMTRTQDGSGYGQAVRKRSSAAAEASKRGAAAALIRSVGTSSHRFAHTGIMSYTDGVPQIPAAAMSAPDADQLARAMARAPVTVRLEISVETRDIVQSGNVIAEIPGRTDDIVVIGAHLDSWDTGTGAVDDGAGVGIVMGSGKAIIDLKRRPERTIRVVLFGAEEVGLLGAFAYAKAHANELDRHVMGAESDFGAGKVYQFQTRYGAGARPVATDMAKVLEPLSISLGDNTASGGPDMTPLRAAGVPMTSLRQNGWDYFDLHHTPNDTFDKIAPDDIAQNVAAYAAFTWMVANMPGDFRHTDDTSAP